MKLNKKYLFAFLITFAIEVIIALFIKIILIRGFVGDILVIVLMYCFIKAFISKPIKLLPLYLFIFASAVEIAQYFNIVEKLNLQDNKFFRIIIGTTFDINDILCYFIGAVILFINQRPNKRILDEKRD